MKINISDLLHYCRVSSGAAVHIRHLFCRKHGWNFTALGSSCCHGMWPGHGVSLQSLGSCSFWKHFPSFLCSWNRSCWRYELFWLHVQPVMHSSLRFFSAFSNCGTTISSIICNGTQGKRGKVLMLVVHRAMRAMRVFWRVCLGLVLLKRCCLDVITWNSENNDCCLWNLDHAAPFGGLGF